MSPENKMWIFYLEPDILHIRDEYVVVGHLPSFASQRLSVISFLLLYQWATYKFTFTFCGRHTKCVAWPTVHIQWLTLKRKVKSCTRTYQFNQLRNSHSSHSQVYALAVISVLSQAPLPNQSEKRFKSPSSSFIKISWQKCCLYILPFLVSTPNSHFSC